MTAVDTSVAEIEPIGLVSTSTTSTPELDSLASEIQREHEAAISAHATTLEHVRCAGVLLAQVRDSLAHGEWLPWLAARTTVSERQARFYMQVAREWATVAEANRIRGSDLSLRETRRLLTQAPPPLAPGGTDAPAPTVEPVALAPRVYTRPLPLVYTVAQFTEFHEHASRLGQAFGTPGISATVLEALRRCDHVRTAPACLPDDAIADGALLDESSYDLLVSGQTMTMLKPDGSVLFHYRDGELPRSLCEIALGVVRQVKGTTANRSFGQGRTRRTTRAGTPAHTTEAAPVPSAVIGFVDRTGGRTPFCRPSAFNADHPEAFESLRPYLVALDRTFATYCPERHAAQMAAIAETPAEFVIAGTAFSTVTVNNTLRTPVHRDKGDLPEGFGVLSVLDTGSYDGGYLVFPKYRVAVDLRTGGVLLADVHTAHGNTAFVGEPGTFERFSVIAYYRRRMRECGTAEEEHARALSRLDEPQARPRSATPATPNGNEPAVSDSVSPEPSDGHSSKDSGR